MDYLGYYHKVGAQKQIDKLARKYVGKRVIVYGAGIMSGLLFETYDLSGLNIVGVCDKKFADESGNNSFFDYPMLDPELLKTMDYDVILVLLKMYNKVIEQIKYDMLMDTKNESVEVRAFIEPSWLMCVKEIIF